MYRYRYRVPRVPGLALPRCLLLFTGTVYAPVFLFRVCRCSDVVPPQAPPRLSPGSLPVAVSRFTGREALRERVEAGSGSLRGGGLFC